MDEPASAGEPGPARRLVVIGPVPPPTHGVAVSTQLILANPRLRERFAMEHLDTTDRRPLETIGTWDATNVRLGLVHLARLRRMLRGERGIVYLPLSQSTGGFARDSLFILGARARGWRVAVHLRGGEFDRFVASLSRPARAWVRRTLRRVDAVAVMGEGLRAMFRELVDDRRVTAVANGSPDEFPGLTPGPRPPLVLFLSNFRERKGLLPALEAARLVLDRVPEARFVFAGEWRSDRLRREVHRRYGSLDGITFSVSPDPAEKRRLFESAAVFLFPPAEPEGHPRVVLEALAAGLPVVTTDRGAIAETVEHERSGFVLPEPDPAALADVLIRLLRDEPLRLAMATAARRRFEDRFTQEAADASIADWLERVQTAS